MSSVLTRRKFLARSWKVGFGLIGAAGLWSTWNFLQPLATSGFGGKVRTISNRAVKKGSVVEVDAARGYLVRPPYEVSPPPLGTELVAFWWKCPHLGCRVPWCEETQRFECPCHGSKFNIAGERLEGPTPRGLWSFPYTEDADGIVTVDTGKAKNGPPPGTITVKTPTGIPACSGGDA